MKRKLKIATLLTFVMILLLSCIPSTTYAKNIQEGKYIINFDDISSLNKKGNSLVIKTTSKKKISTYDGESDKYGNVSGKSVKLKLSSSTQYFISYDNKGEGFLDFANIKEIKKEIKNPSMQTEKMQLIIYIRNGKVSECYCAYSGETVSDDTNNYETIDLGFSLEDFFVADIHIYDCEMDNVSSAVKAYGIDGSPSIQGNKFYKKSGDGDALLYSDGKCMRNFMNYTTTGVLHINSMSVEGNIIDEQPPCVNFPVKCGDSDKRLKKVLALKEGSYFTKDGPVYVDFSHITANPKGVYDSVTINYFNKNTEIIFSYADGKIVGWTVFIE